MRDDFSEEVKRSISARVGNLCSKCGALTSGPQVDPTKALNVGVAAHITAASPLGPRYGPSLTPEERRHADNGVWLCQTCAKLVDNDSNRFKVEDLRTWKQRAEAAALASIGRAGARDEFPSRPVLHAVLKIEPNVGYAAPQGRIEHAFRVFLQNMGPEVVAEYRVEIEFPAG